MLSDETIEYVTKLFIYSDHLLLSPYQWNKQTKLLNWTNSYKHLIFYVFVIIYYTCDIIYLTFVVYHIFVDKTVSYDVAMKVCLHWFTRLVSLTLHYAILRIRHGFSDFYNEFFKFHALLQSKKLVIFSIFYIKCSFTTRLFWEIIIERKLMSEKDRKVT